MAARAEFLGYINHVSDKAILFRDHFWTDAEWLPKSQIMIFPDLNSEMGEVKVSISHWLCRVNFFNEFEHREVVPYEKS